MLTSVGGRVPIVALTVFSGLGLVALPYPQLMGSGKDIDELVLNLKSTHD